MAHASGAESLAAVVLFGGLGLLVWVLLVIADGHRDPLWLSLAVSGTATMALFPSAFARLLCDDDYSCYAACGAAATRFEVAGAVMISLIAAILVREVLRAIRAHRGSFNGAMGAPTGTCSHPRRHRKGSCSPEPSLLSEISVCSVGVRVEQVQSSSRRGADGGTAQRSDRNRGTLSEQCAECRSRSLSSRMRPTAP